MIHEIVNYMKHLKENSPQIFEQGFKPSQGLHIFVKLNQNDDVTCFPGEKGTDWDYYDGKEMSKFLSNIKNYEQQGQRIGTDMNKVFDKKKQLVSCSPYMISFKKDKLKNDKSEGESFEKISNLLDFYFDKAITECFNKDEEKKTQIVFYFKDFLKSNLTRIAEFDIFSKMTKNDSINIYLESALLEDFKTAHNNYLRKNLFNKNDFNSDEEISDTTYGLSGFFNGLNDKKPFLKHKTGTMYMGLAGRIQAKDTVYLNDFDLLLKGKIFPQPLPIFINKNEFENSDEIISIFKNDSRLSYSQILKQLFKDNKERILQNYYLLFFNKKNKKYGLQDFDFVSKFRYSLEENGKYPEIINLFKIKQNKDLKQNYPIKNIFQFEADIIKTIFNNSLVKIKDNSFNANYFGEIKVEYISGGEPIFQMIMKYRKAFYDYIYKSKTQAINSLMWDEIMFNSIIGDLRNDKEFSIKEKLNIWFSLYNHFIDNKGRYEMASKIPELLEKIKKVANNSEEHFETPEEFSFGAGQVIYFLLSKSKAGERTHALLEPFIQKVKAEQLQNSIAQTINTYKHEISFGQGRFERLSAEVLGFDMDENLKKYQRFLLAGYFATPIIYKKENQNDKGEVSND